MNIQRSILCGLLIPFAAYAMEKKVITGCSKPLLTRSQTLDDISNKKKQKVAQFLATNRSFAYINAINKTSDGKVIVEGSNAPDKIDKSTTKDQKKSTADMIKLSLPSCDNGTINLSNSEITQVDPDPSSNLSHIQTLNLKNNYIRQVEWASFLGFDNLVMLDLSHNKIIWLGMNAFKELNKLKVLNLSFNEISHIDSTTFTDVKQLKTLSINNNKLTRLNLSALKDLIQLDNLNISHNLLNESNKKVLRLLLVYTHITF